MSFRRYIAANSREALAQVRRELGDDAVILSNRRVPEGVEVVAAASRTMDRIVQEAPETRLVAMNRPAPVAALPQVPLRSAAGTSAPREKKPVVSIRPEESFQEFVRRQSRQGQAKEAAPVRAPEVKADTPAAASASSHQPAPAALPEPALEVQEQVLSALDDEWKPTTFHMPLSEGLSTQRDRPMRQEHSATTEAARAAGHGASSRVPSRWQAEPRVDASGSLPAPSPAVFRRKAAPAVGHAAGLSLPFATVAPVVSPLPEPLANQQLLDELHALRDQLQKQLEALSSTVSADRRQLHQQITQSLSKLSTQTRQQVHSVPGWLTARLLTAGFSPMVARKLAQHAPTQMTVAKVEGWLHEAIALNVKATDARSAIEEVGGAYALVGPTGVGKTTTVAKLAARFAVRYGSGALGLITLDAYRVGAHDHLRAYGRILGAPVHLAQDAETLRELLVAMQNKRLVLIDSCGLSQRDGRLNEVLNMIDAASAGVPESMRIQRVLLANAASHAETLDETARAWRAAQCAGCILTKLDEAVRIGGALDMVLRYKLRLFGVTNGQRVPEDYHAAHPRVLTHMALRPSAEHFALDGQESVAVAAGHVTPV